MKKSHVVLVMFFLSAFLFVGCGSSHKKVRIGSFTMISTRNVELSKITEASKKIKARGVEGVYLVDGYSFNKDSGEGISAAVENAVNKASGDFMINCTVYRIDESGKKGYMVVGDVIETTEGGY
jgi:hypothetical protein